MEAPGLGQGHARLIARLEGWGLPGETVKALLSRHTLVRYPKGARLFARGAPADVLFAVLSGLAKVYCPVSDGDRVLVDFAAAGDLIGYADFSNAAGQRSQIFEASAQNNCCVALFTRQHMIEVLKAHSAELVLSLAEAMNGLWSTALHRYASLLGMSLRKRLEAVLDELGRRFGAPDARGVLLTLDISQEELAEMIGGSRPMVTKLLAELSQRGLLSREGRRYLLLAKRGADSLRDSIAQATNGGVTGHENGPHHSGAPARAA